MNISKLKKNVVKEFKRSPAKSITLLLLCPVALYFCAPIFKGLLPKPNKSVAVSDDMTAPFPLQLPTETKSAGPGGKTDWREVAKWLASDRLALPAKLAKGVRSPFHYPVPTESASEEGPDEETKAEREENTPRPEPRSARDIFEKNYLTLTTTMVGSHRRMAMVNKRVFSEGNIIPVAIGEPDGAQQFFEFTLTRVDRDSIVLTYGDQTFHLKLQNRIPANAIVVKSTAAERVE